MTQGAVEVLFSLVGFVAFALLTILRFRSDGFGRDSNRRYLLIDFILMVMATEVLLDSLVDHVAPAGSGLGDTLHVASVVARGAVLAGGLALLVTFPAYHRSTTRRRPSDRPAPVASPTAAPAARPARRQRGR